MAQENLDLIEVYAYLDGDWVDLSADVMLNSSAKISASWGIRGIGKFDLVADIGELKFRLKNTDGKYYPDGGSALAGWTRNVPVKLVLTYQSVVYVRFRGYVEEIKIKVGKLDNYNYVDVRCLDWMKYADRFPFIGSSILTDKRADEGLDAILDFMSIPPQATDFQTGTYTFPVIFNNGSLRTTVYTEFARLMNSELGHLYLRKDKTNGETLTFTNSLNDTSGELTATVIDSDILNLELHYGENIINRATAVAYPKSVDTELQVLYSLSNPILIKAGETLPPFRARYTDPNGGGTRVNAITSSMQIPEVPGDPDPYLKTLLNFTNGVIDETGNHTWTAHETDGIIQNDVYSDAYQTKIAGNILGQYLVLGGYSDFRLTAPSSADFNFGSGAFTIGYYENRLFPGRATMARNGSAKPPYMLGVINNEKDMKLFMSSNGTDWDIAKGKSMGEANIGKWTYYEVSRDEDGWFYSFSDGVLVDKWFSPLAFPNATGAFTIGKTNKGYVWFGLDMFFIKKGICMHKKNFTPPKRSMRTVLDGDYLMNSLEDGTGTDLSAYLNITAEYGAEAIQYTLENTSSQDAYVIFLQARGKGVYSYDPIEYTVEDGTSITDFGHKEDKIDMVYQQDLRAGTSIANDLVLQEKNPRTELRSISFNANRGTNTMSNFLNLDTRDLVNIRHTPSGIDNFYRINNIEFEIQAGGIIFYDWGLCPQIAIDGEITTPVDPNFKGVIGIADITQRQIFDEPVVSQTYSAALDVTISDITQRQEIAFNLPEMSVYLVTITSSLGDVTGDSVPSVAGDIPVYTDTSGKHISDVGIQTKFISDGEFYYLTHTASDISTYYHLSVDEPTAGSPETSGIEIVDTDGETQFTPVWISPTIESAHLNKNIWDIQFWFTADATTETTQIIIKLFKRTSGGTETSIGNDIVFDITGNTGGFLETSLQPLTNNLATNMDDRIVVKFYAITAETSPIGIFLVYNSDGEYSYLRIPGIYNHIPEEQLFIIDADVDATSDTTLDAITGMEATLESGYSYSFEALLFVDALAGTGGGFKFDMSGTVTSTVFLVIALVADVVGGLGGGGTYTDSLDTDIVSRTSSLEYTIIMHGSIVVDTGGTFHVRFAQSTATGTSTVLAGSRFVVTRKVAQ